VPGSAPALANSATPPAAAAVTDGTPTPTPDQPLAPPAAQAADVDAAGAEAPAEGDSPKKKNKRKRVEVEDAEGGEADDVVGVAGMIESRLGSTVREQDITGSSYGVTAGLAAPF
jgi:hypothetical protein